MKRIALFSLFVLPVFFLNAQDLAEAKELLNNERYASAEDLLEKKIGETGGQPDLNYLLVKTYLEQKKPADAWSFIEKNRLNNVSSAADPYNKVAYAIYLFSTDNGEKAREILSEILDDKKSKKNIDLLIAVADTYILYDEKGINDALQVIEIAEKRDKNNSALQLLKGNAYRVIHDGSNAYIAYQNAIKNDPSNIRAYYQLGKIFQSQKNDEMYLEQYQKAYTIDSTYAPLLEALYHHYYTIDIKKARYYLEKYLKYTDYSLSNDYDLADMYYLSKEYPAAIALATKILEREGETAQPRLYKMIAYSYDEAGDKDKAWEFLNAYFIKEKPEQFVARDYEFKAKLLMTKPGNENEVIGNFIKAFSLDTLQERKAGFAKVLAETYGKMKDNNSQAIWLGRVYDLKKERTNVDLFNWGLAHYKAGNNIVADSIFAKYTERYPTNIFGYYWRAQVNAAIDTTLELALAVPYYKKVVELGEPDKQANKAMLLKAYGYLGGYEANITKDYPASLDWFEKFLELDPENADASRYSKLLKEWINDPKKNKEKSTDG